MDKYSVKSLQTRLDVATQCHGFRHLGEVNPHSDSPINLLSDLKGLLLWDKTLQSPTPVHPSEQGWCEGTRASLLCWAHEQVFWSHLTSVSVFSIHTFMCVYSVGWILQTNSCRAYSRSSFGCVWLCSQNNTLSPLAVMGFLLAASLLT